MSGHLPECYAVTHRDRGDDRCICTALRACEARVRDEIAADGPWFRSVVHQCCEDKQTAYAAGVQAARDAILPHLAVLTRHACTASNWEQTDALMRRVVSDALAALAAIDALKGEA